MQIDGPAYVLYVHTVSESLTSVSISSDVILCG